MMKQAEDRDFYRKLGSPIRRDIVKLLGEKGQMGATELNANVNVSAGRFYYHLDFLGDLVTRDKERRYLLSERGKLAYQMLIGNTFTEVGPKKNPVEGTLLNVLAPESTLNYLLKTRAIALPLAVAILLITLAMQINYHLMPGLLSLEFSPASTALGISARFLANFIALFAFCYGAAYLLGKRGGELGLIISLALSQVPLAIFSASWAFMSPDLRGGMVGGAMLVFFQIWSMLVLTVTMSKAKKMSYSTSGLIVMGIAYLTGLLARFTVA